MSAKGTILLWVSDIFDLANCSDRIVPSPAHSFQMNLVKLLVFGILLFLYKSHEGFPVKLPHLSYEWNTRNQSFFNARKVKNMNIVSTKDLKCIQLCIER